LSTAEELLADFLPPIEAALEAACQPCPGCPERLGEAIRYSLLAPGKRLRPALVLMAAEACGGELKEALPAAVAVEMVHAYSLIHDDLPAMDDDDLRRGRPTCHIQFDEATAILAGDALLARAFEVLAEGLPAEVIGAAVRVLARAAGPSALVGGQADDLADHHDFNEVGRDLDVGERKRALDYLESIHRRKTGALFAASLELGGLAVRASEEQRGLLVEYAIPFGLAFQIVDDLLDFLGTTEQVGKRTGKDLERGKLTFPGLIGVDASRQRAEQLIAVAERSATLLGERSQRLIGLAQFVLQRSR
jgi:geranylgeranyl diphosphate synthase type II